ncbi:MAG: hypothetical protein V4642_14205 [Bacteroidota bacterium]
MADFENSVFINCPFDEDYRRILRAIIFTIVTCELEPRLASETSDSGAARISKIYELIECSKYSIHDISRIEKRKDPRFNMPFELGVDIGSRIYGKGKLTEKKCLILEAKQYSYQKVLSDLSGNDPYHHNNEPALAVKRVRDWIYSNVKRKIKNDKEHLPTSSLIFDSYQEFDAKMLDNLNSISSGFTQNDIDQMPVPEFIDIVKAAL